MIDYFDAVDIVCLDCHYLSEDECSDCPVRKTVDEIMVYRKMLAENSTSTGINIDDLIGD